MKGSPDDLFKNRTVIRKSSEIRVFSQRPFANRFHFSPISPDFRFQNTLSKLTSKATGIWNGGRDAGARDRRQAEAAIAWHRARERHRR
jgi:hypothetical protein